MTSSWYEETYHITITEQSTINHVHILYNVVLPQAAICQLGKCHPYVQKKDNKDNDKHNNQDDETNKNDKRNDDGDNGDDDNDNTGRIGEVCAPQYKMMVVLRRRRTTHWWSLRSLSALVFVANFYWKYLNVWRSEWYNLGNR